MSLIFAMGFFFAMYISLANSFPPFDISFLANSSDFFQFMATSFATKEVAMNWKKLQKELVEAKISNEGKKLVEDECMAKKKAVEELLVLSKEKVAEIETLKRKHETAETQGLNKLACRSLH